MNSGKTLWLLMGFLIGSGLGILAGHYLDRRPSPIVPMNTAVKENATVNEVQIAARDFIKRFVAHADSINYLSFSESMMERYKSLGVSDPNSYAKLVKIEPRPDSAEVIGIVMLAPESARVFVGEDWFKLTDAFYIKAIGFVKRPDGWRFNGFEFEYQSEGAENTPPGLLK